MGKPSGGIAEILSGHWCSIKNTGDFVRSRSFLRCTGLCCHLRVNSPPARGRKEPGKIGKKGKARLGQSQTWVRDKRIFTSIFNKYFYSTDALGF